MKRISSFSPTQFKSLEEAEGHYVSVHFPYMRDLFRESPWVIHYSTSLVESKRDIGGNFYERPEVWRYVTTEVADETLDRSAVGWLATDARDKVWLDHTRFLRDLCSWEVTAKVVIDNPKPTPTTVKFMAIFSSKVTAHGTVMRDYLSAVESMASRHPACRRYVSNSVLRELDTESIMEPGQKLTGAYIATPSLVAIDEYFFDSFIDGVAFFNDLEGSVDADAYPSSVNFVREEIGLDRQRTGSFGGMR